jgi:putative transposase
MARHARVAPGGQVYHVLNRAVGRVRLFRNDRDYQAFLRVMAEALERHPLRILAYCVMPNHWHFVAWPRETGELTGFFRWLAHTHVMRWRVAHGTVGYGPLYQGRFKSFPVQARDESLRAVCRYVERNARSGGLCRRAEDWRWGSLWVRERAAAGDPEAARQLAMLSEWPVPPPREWVDRVNAPLTAKERQRMVQSMRRGRPFGDDAWVARTADRLGLGHTIRREGRPREEGAERGS